MNLRPLLRHPSTATRTRCLPFQTTQNLYRQQFSGIRAFSDLKRAISSPRSSGTWPDEVVQSSSSSSADDIEMPASDYELNQYLKGILQAQSVIYDVCRETELQYAPTLSKVANNHVYLKREDQQPVFSFKIRGAFNKIASLSPEKKEVGIVACSAGNHAGVALSATRLGLKNLIIMPEGTPKIKVDSVRKFGGNVLLHGKNFDAAQQKAIEMSEKDNMTLIHPFDDFQVICGQGTVGMEILKQIPSDKPIHAVFCSIGGGGLIAGMGVYIKQLSPEINVIGVETEDANAMTQSLQGVNRVVLEEVGLFADGTAVRTPGKNTYSISRRVVDDMVNVTTDDVCQSIKLIFNDTRCIVEPAGALGAAGLLRYVERTGITGETLVCVTSGANMDFDRLRFVSERADRSESLLHVKIPEKQGEFYKLYQHIFPRNVTEFTYRLKEGGYADILLSFQASSMEDKVSVVENLSAEGYETIDYQDNELAKTHIRHLAAGRVAAPDERLFRFEFPEIPGALNQFLMKLNTTSNLVFNVSLFHYRNHGADIGRVLVGIQVPPGEHQKFEDFLQSLGFVYAEETENPAYINFLKL